jgi:Flp pilus assembly protein CpaB
MTYRMRNIVVAIGLALVAMVLTLVYISNYKRSVQHSAGKVQVYVASHDISAGVSGADLIKQHAFHSENVTRSAVVPGAISSPDDIKNLILSGPLYANEQVTIRRFTNVAASGILAHLRGTMRAVQVPGDPNQLLAGTLQAGDKVDLVANLKPNNGTADGVMSRIVLRDLVVITPPSDSGLTSSTPGQTTSAILGVTDTQVQRLFFVLKNGDWTLELRPVINPVDSHDVVETFQSVASRGLK